MKIVAKDTVLSEPLNDSIAVRDSSIFTVKSELHGNIHLFDESTLYVFGVVHGSVVADEHTSVHVKSGGRILGGESSCGSIRIDAGGQIFSNGKALEDAIKERKSFEKNYPISEPF